MDGPETLHKGSDIDSDVRGDGGLILVRGGVKPSVATLPEAQNFRRPPGRSCKIFGGLANKKKNSPPLNRSEIFFCPPPKSR